MAAGPLRISIVGDARDMQRAMGQAESAMEDAADTARRAGSRISGSLDGAAEGADEVASKGAQAAGALSGIGDVVGGPWGAAMQGAGTALQFAADSGDLLNAAIEGGGKIIGKVGAAFSKLGGLLGITTTATEGATVAQEELNVAEEANPIGAVILALTALVAAIVLAIKYHDKITAAVKAAWGVMKKFAGWLAGALGAVLKKAAALAAKIGGAIWTGITSIGAKLKGIGGWVWGKISGLATAITGRVKNAGSRVGHDIWSGITTIGSTLAGIGTWVWNHVAGPLGRLPGKFKDAGVDMIEAMAGGLGGLGKHLGNLAAGVGDAVKKAVVGAANWVIDKINDLLDFTISTGALGKLPGVPDSIHFNAPNIPTIALAQGGIVTGPTVALIGDNPGGREAVIPLDKYDLGGGNTYNVNVYVAPGGDLVEAGRAMTRAIDAYERAGGRRRA